MKEKKKFMSNIDLNKSSEACSPCNLECEKINKRINDRKLSEINTEEVPHILKVFDFWFFVRVHVFDGIAIIKHGHEKWYSLFSVERVFAMIQDVSLIIVDTLWTENLPII